MEFWTQGEAPTFSRFGDAWVSATDARRDLLSPEYSFLTDRRRGAAGDDWKAVRAQKAEQVLAALGDLPARSRTGGRRG